MSRDKLLRIFDETPEYPSVRAAIRALLLARGVLRRGEPDTPSVEPAGLLERIGKLRTLQPGETPYGTLVWLVDVQAAIRLALPTQASDSPEKTT